MRQLASKRTVWVVMGSAIGGGAGWFYATVLAACNGACPLGANPFLTTVLFAVLGGYMAWSTTANTTNTHAKPLTIEPDDGASKTDPVDSSHVG